ncbi:S-adenosyl-L-methionine-dependent methyltransferase [Hypoxylon rubiginosum]|uniref:S-adenosyl-L-methionine-dependent methyltransferase n=1 Tax=Hypoxylon rubiginosum TaxID=110542 RepID=A0ACB9YM81_9PEZI|nr:S-adenosyl-L-methionine-dependent methyltransferase [Hypoxylon rubiginosum]
MPADFEKQSYWHERFASETSFEWLASSQSFMSIIEPYLQAICRERPASILQLGSGTSDLQNYFRRKGCLDVTNVDYEPLALERGRQLEKAAFGDVRMKYVVADVTQLDNGLPRDCKFNLVVDKSTVDAVSCAGETALLRMATGVRNHLADGGFWISLSYSSARFALEQLPFDVEVVAKIPTPKLKASDPDVYYSCYLLRPNMN